MKIYFLICFIMLVLVVLKTFAEIIEYRKKYPHTKWKKESGILYRICTWLKIFIIFCVPLLNLFLFIIIFFADKTFFENAFLKCIEE